MILDRLISKNSPTISTMSNSMIVTCAIVIIIAILVLVELQIRRSIVHPHPADAETWTDSLREMKQLKGATLQVVLRPLIPSRFIL